MKLCEIEEELKRYGVEDFKTEASLIVQRLFGLSPASLIIERERDFKSDVLSSVLEKRKERIPLQYIFGEWDFMGKSFYVSPSCLIPRPDTEILVEKSLDLIKTGDRVADLCTGSGCIGLSVLMYAPYISHLTLMDISKDALDMAKKNATRHFIFEKVRFILGDVCKDMPDEKFDVILTNPPYIPSRDIENLSDEVKKEPRLALDGGEDGLDIIRFLTCDGLSYLNENGKMLIEFGYDQGEIMDTLLDKIKKEGKISSYEIIKDYSQNPRLCVIYK